MMLKLKMTKWSDWGLGCLLLLHVFMSVGVLAFYFVSLQ
jgi:hypothetical protein